VVEAGNSELQKYPVLMVATEEIVDTNGAGDAFAGGLIRALVAGETLKGAIIVVKPWSGTPSLSLFSCKRRSSD